MTTSPQARLINNASESNAKIQWASPFFAPDPFVPVEGLDLEEAAEIKSRNHTILNTGHVVTVEPGLLYSVSAE